MDIVIRQSTFNPWQELEAFQNTKLSPGKFGATSVFIGTMRDFNEASKVSAMHLEYYPGMTEKYLTEMVNVASQKWMLLDALIVHKVGHITPNMPIVLVAVWTAHRAEAFESCRHIMEQLKNNAPFWKQETVNGKAQWVTHNTPPSAQRESKL